MLEGLSMGWVPTHRLLVQNKFKVMISGYFHDVPDMNP